MHLEDLQPSHGDSRELRAGLDAGFRGMKGTANAAMVNRAHRVVRERAKSIKERRSKIRSLWLPIAIFFCLAYRSLFCGLDRP